MWEQRTQPRRGSTNDASVGSFGGEEQVQVARELGENLSANAAGWRRAIPADDEHTGDRVAMACSDHREHGRSFGTDARAERRVLHVAAGEDSPAARDDRRSHSIVRVRRIRAGARLARGVQRGR